MLKRYGGPLDKPKFDAVSFCAIKSPPLSSFAMFAEVHAEKKAPPFIDLSKGMSRPKVRDSMPVEARHTGKEPVLLKVLAMTAQAPVAETEVTGVYAPVPEQTSPKRKRNKRPTLADATSTRRATTSLSCFMEVEES